MVCYSTADGVLSGKGKDNRGEEWTIDGWVKNKQVYLVNTFKKDGQKWTFSGTFSGTASADYKVIVYVVLYIIR